MESIHGYLTHKILVHLAFFQIVQSCTNYRGIKLMSHTMKLWERVIEHRLRRVTSVTQNQFGFMPGRSTMEAIFFNTTIDGEI